MGLQSLVQKRLTVQPALLWTRRTNTPSGKPEYNKNPTEIRVRWDAMFVEVIGDDGRSITSNATIMSPFEMPVGSWIFQGTLADWRALSTYPALPNPTQGGYEIIRSGHHPDFNGADLLYLAYV